MRVPHREAAQLLLQGASIVCIASEGRHLQVHRQQDTSGANKNRIASQLLMEMK